MKTISTEVSTGTKIQGIYNGQPQNLFGEIGTIKNGQIKVFWQHTKYSGFNEYLTTRELNRRIKNNQILILN